MGFGWFSATETVLGRKSVLVAGRGRPGISVGAVSLRTAGDVRAAKVAAVTSPAHPRSAAGGRWPLRKAGQQESKGANAGPKMS